MDDEKGHSRVSHVGLLGGALRWLLLLLSTSNVTAANFSLDKVSPESFEFQKKKIEKSISDDDAKKEILPFDREQSFVLEGQNHQRS